MVASIGHDELQAVWGHYEVKFSARAWDVPGLGARVERLACRTCGFDFFDPARAGNEAFYEELHSQLPGYYPRDCVSFQRAVRFAARHGLKSVLDVGCGCGNFLGLAREVRPADQHLGTELQGRCRCQAASAVRQHAGGTRTRRRRERVQHYGWPAIYGARVAIDAAGTKKLAVIFVPDTSRAFLFKT